MKSLIFSFFIFYSIMATATDVCTIEFNREDVKDKSGVEENYLTTAIVCTKTADSKDLSRVKLIDLRSNYSSWSRAVVRSRIEAYKYLLEAGYKSVGSEIFEK